MKTDKTPVRVAYERRNRDLDPQLVWRSKTNGIGRIWSSSAAAGKGIREKVHPKALIDDLLRRSKAPHHGCAAGCARSFNFAGQRRQDRVLPATRIEPNRMILGDSLRVMAKSGRTRRFARQGAVHHLRNLPYGIKFNSNFQ
ncbi:MAG: hypothetical protein U0X75_17915 [Acidobacteriota bacterium]